MDHLDKAYAAFQMRAEIREPLTILRFRTESDAVGQDRLQHLNGVSTEIELAIHYDPGEALSNASSHYPSLVMIDAEAFLEGDGGRMR